MSDRIAWFTFCRNTHKGTSYLATRLKSQLHMRGIRPMTRWDKDHVLTWDQVDDAITSISDWMPTRHYLWRVSRFNSVPKGIQHYVRMTREYQYPYSEQWTDYEEAYDLWLCHVKMMLT